MNSNRTITRPRTDYGALARREDGDAVLVTSLQGEIVHWDERAQRLFGYGADEAMGRTPQDLLLPVVGRAGDDDPLRSRVLANGPATFEAVVRRKDGALLLVEITSRIAEGGEAAAIVMAVRDITRLRVLRDARLVEARFRELLESMPDGVVLVNATGRIVYANSQLAHLFGYPPQALQGLPVDELLPPRLRAHHLRSRPDDAPRPRAGGWRAWRLFDPLRERIRYTLELSGLRRDGSEFPLEISLSALQLDSSELVMSAIRDITERKRVEDELRRKNIELEQASRAKNRFLATMSHELRTPLNAIIGFTGTLLMKLAGPLTADQERQLRTVQSSGRHLLSLINDLLDLARIESGKVDLPLAETSCTAVVEDVVATLRPLADDKRLALRVERPAGAVKLRSNERALNQILINLVSNAIRFTDAGEVVIRVEESLSSAGRLIEISVSDTGPGIRKEEQARLFEAFAQLEAGARHRHEGTGLGLHLSQKLAGLLGARIVCESELGHGSRFTLQLPAPP